MPSLSSVVVSNFILFWILSKHNVCVFYGFKQFFLKLASFGTIQMSVSQSKHLTVNDVTRSTIIHDLNDTSTNLTAKLPSIPQKNPLSYFSFQPVLHEWCNIGCGMCYSVCGMVHIKEPLLLIRKSSPCSDDNGFLSCYLNGSLLYVSHHITINKMC